MQIYKIIIKMPKAFNLVQKVQKNNNLKSAVFYYWLLILITFKIGNCSLLIINLNIAKSGLL